jgi:hypothetical protein
MQIIKVNITAQEVTTNGQTCNFTEAGLHTNDGASNPIGDVQEIIEHLMGEDDNVQVIVQEAEEIVNGKIVTDENGCEWLSSKHGMIYLNRLTGGYFEGLEGEVVTMNVPDEVGGESELNCKVIKNQECENPVLLTDLVFVDQKYWTVVK